MPKVIEIGWASAGRGRPYFRMVEGMEKRKVTFLIPAHTLDAARSVAPEGNMSAFADRALRNEILRMQLAATPLPEIAGWLDEAEEDEAGAA